MSVRRWRRSSTDSKTPGRWVVDIKFRRPDGTAERIRRFPRVQTKAAAERLERELLVQLEQGDKDTQDISAFAPVPTLNEFWDEFFAMHVVPNNKPSEQEAKRVIYRSHLSSIFGNQRLDAITARDLERYKAHKLTVLGYAPKSVNNQLAVLRGLLHAAKRWQIISEVPSYKELRIPSATTRFLSSADANALIAAATQPWRSMITFCLNTGIRIGEMLALQWQDINMTAKRLVVQRNAWRDLLGPPKGGRNRNIALNSAAMAALAAVTNRTSIWVFCSTDGKRFSHAMCRRPLHRACVTANLKLLQWHTLRHTFASHLVAAGVPLRAIQTLLGHANYATTERYAHLAPSATADAVDKLTY